MKKHILWLLNTSQSIHLHIILSSVVGILHVCTSLLFVWVCKQLIDIATDSFNGKIEHYAALLIATIAIELILSAWSSRLENQNETLLKNKLRYHLFSHLMLSTWNRKQNFHSGDIVNRLEEDVRIVSEALCKALPSVGVTCFQLIAGFLFLFHLDNHLAWIIILIMPVFLVSSKFYMNRISHLTKSVRNTDSLVQSHIQEKLQYKVLIQTIEQNQAVADKLDFFQTGLYKQVMNRTNFTLFSRTLVMAGFATGYVIAFLWGVNGIYKGFVSFGLMTAFLQLVGQIQRPMVELSRYLPSLAHAITSAERLTELQELPTEKQGKPLMLDGQAGIELKNVSFSYPDGDKLIIKNFSFSFTPGSRTAIIGETGIGKSTLIRLMLSILHPQEGNIYIYDQKQKIEASPLTRCNLIYVPQGNTLLSGTVRDNLLLGDPNATNDLLQKALTTAVAEFVYNLPDGLDTICGEHGAGLSEGQAQRICIARGLLRPGSILLLDELSSSLDKDTERTLMERLISKTRDKTLIFITHREIITEYCAQKIILQ